MKARKDKRTSISLAQVVWDWAMEMMEAKGYNDNISAYIADLIRRDKERQEEKESQKPKSSSSTSYPPHREELARAEDKPADPQKKPKAA
jgi:hypothetical protein